MSKQVKYLIEENEFMAKGASQEALEAQVVFERGNGVYLYDMEGNSYMDFSAGIITNSLGQCHPYISEQLKEQIDTLGNIHDFSSTKRIKLIKQLRKFIPKHLDTFAFYSTGSEAIEASLRVVSSYYSDKDKRVSALRYGFHGKSMGARLLVDWRLSTDPYSNSKLAYSAMCYRCPFKATYPNCDIMCAQLACKHVFSKREVGAFIFEPILGSAGVFIPPKEYWTIIKEACDKSGILMIADEVLTSGGRIGEFLASDYYGISPDILVMAKGIASGFPFSTVVARSEIMNSEEFSRPGASSSTFSSHPFGIRAALATLEVIERENIIEHVKSLESIFLRKLEELKEEFEFIGDVRGIGLLAAIEFVEDKRSKTPNSEIAVKVFRECLKRGIKLCLGGNIIRICPPLNITKQELEYGMDTIKKTLKGMGK